MIGEAARQAGARIIATGDTARLGAVEAGGMLALLAREVPAAQLHEVRRFEAQWEREASVRLRDGDPAAVAAYDRHGRVSEPPHTCPGSRRTLQAKHLAVSLASFHRTNVTAGASPGQAVSLVVGSADSPEAGFPRALRRAARQRGKGQGMTAAALPALA